MYPRSGTTPPRFYVIYSTTASRILSEEGRDVLYGPSPGYQGGLLLSNPVMESRRTIPQ